MASNTKKEVPAIELSEGGKESKNKKSPNIFLPSEENLNKTHNDNIRFSSTSVDKLLLIGISIFAAIILAIFCGLKFANGSFADVYVGSQKVSANINQIDLENKIHTATASYKLKIRGTEGSTKSYGLKDTGVTVNERVSARNAKNKLESFRIQKLIWWKPIRIELATQINDQAFNQFISAKATQVKKSPANASIKIKGSAVRIEKEKQGTGSTVLNAETVIPRSIAQLNQEPLIVVPATLEPKIKTKDLQKSKHKIEFLITRKVKFKINGQSITAKPKEVAAWLDLNTVVKAKTVDVTINSGKILEYINKVAAPYIQPPRSKLITHTDQGLTVLDNGADGVDIVSKDQTAADVAKKLPEGHDLTVDLSVKYAPAKTVEVTPHDKWVVADVTNKRMYAYEGTKLVRTFLISAGAPLTPTVLGTYHIYAKYKSQDMRGANVDGSRYFQPAVPYVNYFYQDYAIHGNYWRPLSYFGYINISHGCVGMTTSDSEWVYNWAPIGTTVIIHS